MRSTARAWLSFFLVQGMGFLCLPGGERFAITNLGYKARIFALIALEPGVMTMEGVVEKTLFSSGLTTTQEYWLGIFLGILFNTICFAVALLLFRRVRKSRLRQ